MQKRWGDSFKVRASGSFLLACLCLLFSLTAPSALALDGDEKEDDVRAAIIMAILRYTTWEADVEFFNICLLGNNPRFSRLERIDDSIKIHDKPIQISRLTHSKYAKNKKNKSCQVILVGENNTIDIEKLLGKSACVVICDDCEHERALSAIVVRKDKDRIRFDVDLTNATSQGVKFSAKMLELAASVKGLPPSPQESIGTPTNDAEENTPASPSEGSSLELEYPYQGARYAHNPIPPTINYAISMLTHGRNPLGVDQ